LRSAQVVISAKGSFPAYLTKCESLLYSVPGTGSGLVGKTRVIISLSVPMARSICNYLRGLFMPFGKITGQPDKALTPSVHILVFFYA
jgi:hypothetical protein